MPQDPGGAIGATACHARLRRGTGHLPLESADATFLFEAVSKRYEAGKSIIRALGIPAEILVISSLSILEREGPPERPSTSKLVWC